jgi:hypothetical protein
VVSASFWKWSRYCIAEIGSRGTSKADLSAVALEREMPQKLFTDPPKWAVGWPWRNSPALLPLETRIDDFSRRDNGLLIRDGALILHPFSESAA